MYVRLYNKPDLTFQTRPTKWCPHEPNDAGSENCVEYRNRCWNDKSCATALKFVCQKPPSMLLGINVYLTYITCFMRQLISVIQILYTL